MCYAIATGVGLYLGVLTIHSIVEFIEKKITKEKDTESDEKPAPKESDDKKTETKSAKKEEDTEDSEKKPEAKKDTKTKKGAEEEEEEAETKSEDFAGYTDFDKDFLATHNKMRTSPKSLIPEL